MIERFRANSHGTWHCIVGRTFSAYVTYETKNYVYLYIGQTAILLFKTGWLKYYFSNILF